MTYRAPKKKLGHHWDKPDGMHNWMTIGEIAKFIGVHRETAKRWQAEGRLPPPAARTSHGWALWSPDQQTAILRDHSRAHCV